jgi:uncharacterized protein
LKPVGGGFAAGLVSGLFGVGGGVLLIPVLVLLLRRSQHIAHATSLAAITVLATAGTIRFGLGDAVSWFGAAAIVVGSLAGVEIGAAIMPRVRERPLQLMFAAVLALIAIRLLLFGDAPLGEAREVEAELSVLPLLAHAVLGLGVGVLSGLLGIGGGSVIVPALVLLFGYDQHLAEGTSLAVIIPTAALGAISHARRGYTDWATGGRLGLGGAVGALIGAEVALAIPSATLARAFGVLLAVVTVLMVRRR